MNNEIIKSLTGREYITTFINKDIRVDRRNLLEKRKSIYQFGILDSFSTSASCMLGSGTKVIAVMKSHNAPISESESNFLSENTNKILDLHIENLSESSFTSSSSSGKLASSYSEPNLLHFINKLIEDNLELEVPVPLRFSLHISIINSDGNIYDCIAYLISNLFSGKLTKANECGLNRYLKLKRNFISNTFCIIGDKLILDPTAEEVKYSNYYFSVLNFNDGKQGEYIIHKIKGDSISFGILEDAMLKTKHG